MAIRYKSTFSYNYKTWMNTHIRVFILTYTYNYMNSYTIIESLWNEHLYEYLYLGIHTIY